MITRLENFKNFADETLRPGPFIVIVGANASGKSDIRDAFRFLHGIGRGYALADIVGGKYGTDGQWTGSPSGQEVLNSRGVSRAARFARRYRRSNVGRCRLQAERDLAKSRPGNVPALNVMAGHGMHIAEFPLRRAVVEYRAGPRHALQPLDGVPA